MPVAYILGTLHRRPQLFLSCTLVAWGVVFATIAVARTTWQLYTLRVLLGITEAGALPGIYYYIGRLVPNQQLPVTLWPVEAGILVAQVVAAPLALGVFNLDGVRGLYDWQWLFLVEGCVPVLLGFALLGVLPASVDEVRGLEKEEYEELRQAMQPTLVDGDGLRGAS